MKKPKRYDYVRAIDQAHETYTDETEAAVRKVLRKLVRDAVLESFVNQHLYVHGHGGNIDANAVAKELVP